MSYTIEFLAASENSPNTLGFIKNETLVFVNFSAQSASILSSRGDPDDSKTPPTCKVWMIFNQVMAT